MYKTTLFLKGKVILIILIMPSVFFLQVGVGLTNPTAQLTVNEDAIFNESGGNHDFRIESDLRTNMFFVDASTNRIGVNTNTPLYTFQVVNVGNIGATYLTESTNSGTNGIALSGYNSNAANGYNAFESATEGTYSAVFGLHLPTTGGGFGGYFATNSPIAAWAGWFNGDINVTGTYYNISDVRFKDNISPLTGSLNKILQLNPTSYTFKTEEFSGLSLQKDKLHFGFIAQELDQVFPELVNKDKLISNPKKKTGSLQKADNVS